MRFLLDRRAEAARAVGYARVVREELSDAARRLDADNLWLLPTSAWEQYSSDLAGALLEEEFLLLNATYRAIAVLNARMQNIVAPIPGAAPFPATVDDQTRHERAITAALVAQGLSAVAWLARGDVPLVRRRRVAVVMTVDPLASCRCAHRWDHHRWEWKPRRVRLRWRQLNLRIVAHECNVEGCSCRWFREPGATHLPRWFQRFGPGTQGRPLGHDEPDPEPGPDPSIPATAQPGAIVDASEP
ncbi:hypothetical protein FSW04_20115 [Baekduia soli]|uniref:Uncharacterized protein n=1 Tax=Baekduia soli TaxID=496014 RepID=A0A5B8U924_9ACTN|nr:hypothetical protein [Baekduia soli]QEC49653.1 hypothetical protein FSW04_20115 [Baekduia soli]